ncbi:MAG TPA: TAXI family TRAP transporter solute-binding subunit [Opitutaceae bacterium]|nr:TAXI family TRAP transporter solute-binding subunit [Opitutaceae bacterium]
MNLPQKKTRSRPVTMLMETFGLSPALAVAVVTMIGAICLFAVIWFVASAPPRTLTVTSGPAGSSFQRYAERYREKLAEHGVTLRILPSEGSQENLRRLAALHSGIDIGFVQSGLVGSEKLDGLVSLGSIAYQPLWIFYHSTTRISRLAELAGKRIAVGEPGSGTHVLALALLQANGITGAPTTLLNVDADDATADLLAGKIDAVFFMGDSAPIATLRTLIRSPNVQVFNFTQADAYIRRLTYLNKMVLPEGSINLGEDLPAQDIVLIGPTVELVARQGLNSALSDLLIEVAQEIHGKAGLLQKSGEFPAPLEHEIKMSDDALRYYKSGKGLLARTVGSFWLASVINRALVAFLPMILVLVPAIRLLPVAYKWRIQLRIYRCYRPLLLLERDAAAELTAERRLELIRRLDEIEGMVNHLRVPASFADQFYSLRGHIAFVRARLRPATPG